jgi:hypothetical protein
LLQKDKIVFQTHNIITYYWQCSPSLSPYLILQTHFLITSSSILIDCPYPLTKLFDTIAAKAMTTAAEFFEIMF